LPVKAWRWLASQFFPLGVIVWAHGILLRWTVRDSVDALAPLYYATPWPVIAALTLPLSWRFRRNPQAVFAGLFLTHVFMGLWLLESARTGDRPRVVADLRVVQWNVARPVRNFPAVAQSLRAMGADVIAISEPLPARHGDQTTPQTARMKAEWRKAFPEQAAVFSDGNLLLLVRGEIVQTESGPLADGGVFAQHEVRVRGRAFRVLQIDLEARPTHSRRAPLAALAEKVRALEARPLIVLGDFNTPRDSVHFAPLRREVVNAFEKAGFGLGDTWPMPLPVLSLDQIWCGRGLAPLFCEHYGTVRSDHRPVVADLRFE
jgi:endonuclease/exonuclease/phosphatase family metal-dependent hydrolase